MDFNSLDEAIKYIGNVCQSGLNSVKDDMKDIMEEQLDKYIYDDHTPELYERTDQLKDTPVVMVGNQSIVAEFVDNGDWEKWSGGHFFPLLAWDREGSTDDWVKRSQKQGGGVYPKVPILLDSYNEMDNKIPIEFKKYLISRGLEVENGK